MMATAAEGDLSLALRIAAETADLNPAFTAEDAAFVSTLCVPTATVPPLLADAADILGLLLDALHRRGVVGEDRFSLVTYLCLTSRVLDQPVSLVAKGPSSSGKSFVTQRVLDFFPPSAYYALSAMSEHALAYSEEPLSHRFLVLYEASGLENDLATYLIRSLLSEGRIRYETVEKVKGGGLQPRLIEREGPTGLLITTTAVMLHPENETRLLSVTSNDSREQTKHILRTLAFDDEDGRNNDDLSDWCQLQEWLAEQDNRVAIPFATALAELVPPVAVRLRRDFGMLLSLIRTSAILHQRSRKRDGSGRIVASLADYEITRTLVGDLIADQVEATVPAMVRATAVAVGGIHRATEKFVTYQQLADKLELDKSAARRRALAAIQRGFVRNLQEKRGQPAQLVPADALPEDAPVLPEVAVLTERWHGGSRYTPRTNQTPSTEGTTP